MFYWGKIFMCNKKDVLWLVVFEFMVSVLYPHFLQGMEGVMSSNLLKSIPSSAVIVSQGERLGLNGIDRATGHPFMELALDHFQQKEPLVLSQVTNQNGNKSYYDAYALLSRLYGVDFVKKYCDGGYYPDEVLLLGFHIKSDPFSHGNNIVGPIKFYSLFSFEDSEFGFIGSDHDFFSGNPGTTDHRQRFLVNFFRAFARGIDFVPGQYSRLNLVGWLGEAYFDGFQGMRPNYNNARILFEKIAMQKTDRWEQAHGNFYLGLIYHFILKNSEVAEWYFKKAFKQKDNLFAHEGARFYLSEMRYSFKASALEEQKLIKIYTELQKQADHVGVQALSFLRLGEIHYKNKNFSDAWEYFLKASYQSVDLFVKVHAYYYCGLMYLNGYHVEQNPETAKKFFEYIAKQDVDDTLACKAKAMLAIC
jgi:Sel1 repeat